MQAASPPHSGGMPVDELPPVLELPPELDPELPDSDELPSTEPVVVVGNTLVEPASPEEDESDPAAGGSEKHPVNTTSATTHRTLMRGVSHTSTTQKARCERQRAFPKASSMLPQRRDMKSCRMYQNNRASAENRASAAATCWLTR